MPMPTLPFVTALAVMVAAYVILAWSLSGWGLLVPQRTPMSPGKLLVDQVWAGFAVALLAFQLLNLVAPLVAPVSLAFFGGGLLLSRAKFWRTCAGIRRSVARPGWLLALFILIALWIATQAVKSPVHYDSGLYHFSSIRWLNEYAVVPGLANLHGRLGFNQSFFTFVAALNFHPWFSNGHNFANSFLVTLLLFELFTGFHTWLGRSDGSVAALPVGVMLRVFALPIPVYFALQGNLSSPWPDIAVTVVLLALFFRFADWEEEQDPHTRSYQAWLILLLSAVAVTIKTSSIVFAGALAAITLWQRQRDCRDTAWRTVAADLLQLSSLPVLLLLIWMARGVITSGYPLYPATVGRFTVDWAVPAQDAINEANWIYSWARQPSQHWSVVLSTWDWVLPWVLREAKNVVGFTVPVAATVLLFTLYLWLRVRARSTGGHSPRLLVLLTTPVLLGLVFWFLTAPSPRFAQAVIWLLPMLGGYAVLTQLNPLNSRSAPVYQLMIWGVVNCAFLAYPLVHPERIMPALDAGFAPIPTVQARSQPIQDGFFVHTPQEGELCWSTALPCTPYYDPDLRRRGPRLQDGFAADLDAPGLGDSP